MSDVCHECGCFECECQDSTPELHKKIYALTAQLDASQALLAERDKLIENQQAEIESRNQLRYDALKGEHSRSPYYYDSWCKLHDHKGVIGTSDKPPIHYAVNLLNRLTEQLAERDKLIENQQAEIERLREKVLLPPNPSMWTVIRITKLNKLEAENSDLRAEVERLKQNIVDTLTERLSDVETARKQAAQEIVDMLRADRWAESELRDIIDKFGLERLKGSSMWCSKHSNTFHCDCSECVTTTKSREKIREEGRKQAAREILDRLQHLNPIIAKEIKSKFGL